MIDFLVTVLAGFGAVALGLPAIWLIGWISSLGGKDSGFWETVGAGVLSLIFLFLIVVFFWAIGEAVRAI